MLGVENHRIVIRGEYAKRLCDMLDGKVSVKKSTNGECVNRTQEDHKDSRRSYEVVWE